MLACLAVDVLHFDDVARRSRGLGGGGDSSSSSSCCCYCVGSGCGRVREGECEGSRRLQLSERIGLNGGLAWRDSARMGETGSEGTGLMSEAGRGGRKE